MENREHFVMTTGTQPTPLLRVDSSGIQRCWLPTAVLTLVLARAQSGLMICSAVVKRKASMNAVTEALDDTTVVTVKMLVWPVLVVRITVH